MKAPRHAFSLTSGSACVTISESGELLTLSCQGTEWHTHPGPFWEMTLQAPSTPSVLGVHRRAEPASHPAIEKTDETLVLRYDGMVVDAMEVDITVEVSILAQDGEFAFLFDVINGSESWTVREIRAPLVCPSLSSDPAPALLWPLGAGERFPDPSAAGVMSVAYPMRLFMPWLALDAGSRGLYLASHDEHLQTVTLNVDACRSPDAIVLSVNLFPFCGPGETTAGAPILLRPYVGSWHAAASRYRRWADTWFKPVAPPTWVKDASGWQLAILKQQNGEIHWPYADVDALIDLGAENGLNVLGLYGWTEGGHDRRYPIYEPDPAMGGATALRQAIEKAHAAGQRVVLYTNGQLRDILCEWHDRSGHESAAVSERGDCYGESWLKYQDAPPRRMSYGCQGSDVWSDTLLELAKQVEALGADGIIFDQLGCCQPMFCFSDRHAHAKPSQATGPGLTANLTRVQAAMQAINSDFAIMVEHVTDSVNRYVDFTHGCGTGFHPGGRSFPEMLRFTFPEIRATQRHPTPVMDRNTANWACLYGFAHEVEYRYWPDRLYVEKGIAPEFSDYERVCSPPDIGLMRSLDPRRAADYLRLLIAFEERHADLLREGTFRDSLGFTVGNPKIEAKGFENGQSFGCLLRNPTDQWQRVLLDVPESEYVGADAPEAEPDDADALMPPYSVRLVRYRRR